jgi:thiol-disulfide isomerase/thioredoxin
MSWRRFTNKTRVFWGLTAVLGIAALARGQGVENQPGTPASNALRPAASDENIKSINDNYNQELLQVERRRLERLARLAARQNPADAAATYEVLFRLAIAADLFREAEPAAKTVLNTGSPSVLATGLAHLVKIIAEADRGAYEQSVESLQQAVAEREKAALGGAPRMELPTDEVVEICDAYYQRLLQTAQFEKARKALQVLLGHTQRPVVKEFLSSRVRRLDQVGKPAPAIQGIDTDGKPFDLADAKGKVVLVVFWASWCPPCADEIEPLQEVADSYGARGLQIVGINLDAMQDGGPKPESSRTSIRRFLLDHNVDWPTLINGHGGKDYAKAFGVTEIPANVLIARDMTIAHIDLVPKSLEPVIARALGAGNARIP